MSNDVGVSLITTVKNEEASIDAFLRSVLAQTRPPDEIVIVDGGSTDRTLERMRAVVGPDRRVAIVEAPGANIAQGRNVAIERARGPVIAVADAGTVLRGDWLETIVRPLVEDDTLAVCSGFFDPGGRTWLERTISVVITPREEEIDLPTFLPSSRSLALRKAWWQRAGGYPEWLRHCEDLVFDLELRRLGARFAFAPEARVTWRARKSLPAFFCQYRDYARGDGHAHLWARRHLARYVAYGVGAVLAGAAVRSPWSRGALTAAVFWHLRRYLLRVARTSCFTSNGERAAAFAATPVIVVAGDVAKMIGYPQGLLERARAGSPQAIPDVLGAHG